MSSPLRAQRVADVQRLREEEGLTYREIGERLGISLKMAHHYYADPDGSRARARKDKSNGTCVDCGGETHNGGNRTRVAERCAQCWLEWMKTPEARRSHVGGHGVRWSDDEIFAAMRSVARNGVLTASAYEAARAQRRRGSMPSVPTIKARFGRWALAVEAAGLRSPVGGYGERSDRTPLTGLLLAIGECVAALSLDRPPTVREYQSWAQEVGAPSVSTITHRFGGWVAATEAYEDQEAAADLAVAA